MAAKNLYLDKHLIAWVDKQRLLQDRTFSNYISRLIKKEMEYSEKLGKGGRNEK